MTSEQKSSSARRNDMSSEKEAARQQLAPRRQKCKTQRCLMSFTRSEPIPYRLSLPSVEYRDAHQCAGPHLMPPDGAARGAAQVITLRRLWCAVYAYAAIVAAVAMAKVQGGGGAGRQQALLFRPSPSSTFDVISAAVRAARPFYLL